MPAVDRTATYWRSPQTLVHRYADDGSPAHPLLSGCVHTELRDVEFDALRWLSTEIGVTDPGGSGTDVGDARPGLTFTSVGDRLEVQLLELLTLGPVGLIRDALVLHGAESYAKRLTAFDIAADDSLSEGRLWADLGDGTPDSICVDAEGAVWYADVPNKCCVRFAKEARSSSGSTTIAAASHARSEGWTGRRSSSSPRSGGGPSKWPTESEPATC
jgi:SMP-30/Gluconolactonase/LRE-like region